ncbi:universal stress protein [Bacillus sp. CGMCC 1.16541]|uniref:universal stress protein n=1 Tax=Bacillus sp. CGMCC 1.16541 TaxID=2185143 RepID=UPI000D72C76D|nr:universal stress protein [Bacillus sp. CGMCC 1.16541]
MFKRILLASDGSEHATRATEKAVELASLTKNSFIQVVYAVDVETIKNDVINNFNSLDRDVLREERMKATQSVLEKSDVEYEMTFIHGDAAKTIIDFANHNKFDVVVVGSRGLNPVKEMFLGSVSHKVAQRVKVPVLIVK